MPSVTHIQHLLIFETPKTRILIEIVEKSVKEVWPSDCFEYIFSLTFFKTCETFLNILNLMYTFMLLFVHETAKRTF